MSLDFRVKKSFDGFDIDASLSMGEELLVLFGPSGAGKSLILKMISGIVAPDEGAVTIGATRVFDSAFGVSLPIRQRRIGYLFQEYALFPHMTVNGNIAYGISHLKSDAVKSKVAGLINVMRLGGLEDRYPHELSGGQKQRCALARTLAAEPKVLLLDEPFSALDLQVREKLRADLLNIHELYPITTVFVTHDLEEAFMLGKKIAVLNNGRVEQAGAREDIFYRPATRNVARFMGARNIFDGTVVGADGKEVTLLNQDVGIVKAFVHRDVRLEAGQGVSFCIRPEEVIVIRPDRELDYKVQDNILEGEIVSTVGKGSTQIMFLRIIRAEGAKEGSGGGSKEGEALLKIELPNFVVRKLSLATGRRIRVSLKKENVWVIP